MLEMVQFLAIGWDTVVAETQSAGYWGLCGSLIGYALLASALRIVWPMFDDGDGERIGICFVTSLIGLLPTVWLIVSIQMIVAPSLYILTSLI